MRVLISDRPVAFLGLLAALAAAVLSTSTARGQEALPASVEAAVRAEAAAHAGVDASQVEILRSEAVTWRDGCMGSPVVGPICTQALVPGFAVWVQAGANATAASRWHTNSDGSIVLFGEENIALDAVATAALPSAAIAGSANGDASFTGEVPGAGQFGLLVAASASAVVDLSAALQSAGCEVGTLAVTAEGEWLVYVSGAPAFVNAEFPTQIDTGRVFLVRCAA